MDSIYLTQPKRIEEACASLHEHRVLLVEFAAEGTRYPLLIVKDTAVKHVGREHSYGGGTPTGKYHYVGLMEFGRSGPYPFRLGELHSSYVGEKLGLNEADAANVTVFLNCLGKKVSEIRDYLDSVSLISDHVNHRHLGVVHV